jgi:hypothetical protein
LDGFVICADSQETVGEYRVSRLKLSPRKTGNFDLVIAGSGNDGELIDSLVERLHDNIGATMLTDFSGLKEFIQHEILDFQRNEAMAYPASLRKMRFIIGARKLDSSGSILWRTSASRLREVDTYALIGFEDERYEYAVKNFYAMGGLTIAQGIFLGLYVMWLAEQTCNSVKAPVSVVVLQNAGMHHQSQDVVDQLTTRVKLFTAEFEKLFLACPDTGLLHGEFAEKLNAFVDGIILLRKEYVEEWAGKAVEEGLDKFVASWTLAPNGTTIVIQPNDAQSQSLRRMAEEGAALLQATVPHLQDPQRLVSNLESLRSSLEDLLMQATRGSEPSVQGVNLSAHNALSEICQAAMMGPFRVSPEAHFLLQKVANAMVVQLQFGEHIDPQFQHATNLYRMAVVLQAMAFLQRATP